MDDLYASFIDLPRAVINGEFQALPLSPRRKDFLAKNDGGTPVFLLHDASTARYTPALKFRHLSAQFHVTCRVQTNEGAVEDRFCLILCDEATTELHEIFVRCISAAIEELPNAAGTRELETCILQLQDLFRALAVPSSREVSGLWAELFIVSRCGNPARAISLWHEDQFDRFDFSSSSMRLEVKSSVRGIRAHDFALEQLEPPLQGHGCVASMLLQPLTGGVGVLELARSIEAAVMSVPRIRQKLWHNVATALGGDFSDKLDRRFDPVFAEKHLIIYSMKDVPRPATPSDPRVTALRFVSDLSSVVSSLQSSSLPALIGFFRIG